jgi:putative transposase
MTSYLRPRVPGAAWFFTVNLAQRSGNHLLVEHVEALRNAIRKVKDAHPFTIEAMVVLPDHLHCIWTLPPGDADYGIRWALIKAGLSRSLAPTEARSTSRIKRGERGIWQRRFWEHMIRDEQDFQRHVDYIHWNPVKHGHSTRVADWPYSSFHTYVRRGVYPLDWASEPADALEAGEPSERFGPRDAVPDVTASYASLSVGCGEARTASDNPSMRFLTSPHPTPRHR